MKNFKKQKGITLVALVVTIIVLLILAGVSLSLVAGENGILGRATTAVDKNKIETAKEQVGLLITDKITQFYEEKYVNKTAEGIDSKKAGDYIKEALAKPVATDNGEFYAIIYDETSSKKLKVYAKADVSGENVSGTPICTGTIGDDGKITWDSAPVENTTE